MAKIKYLAVVQHDVPHDSLIAEADSIEELIDDVLEDVETYKIDKVKYLIYEVTEEEIEQDDFFAETDNYMEFERIDNSYEVSDIHFKEKFKE